VIQNEDDASIYANKTRNIQEAAWCQYRHVLRCGVEDCDKAEDQKPTISQPSSQVASMADDGSEIHLTRYQAISNGAVWSRSLAVRNAS
jgi:hypothetical protein